jgi:hypothetical protein
MDNCTESNRAACPRLCSDFCNAKEDADARRSAAAGSVEVNLTDAENTALDELCTQKDMTRQGVMLVALRLYQAVALGAAEVAWRSTGPIGCMGDDCPPNETSGGTAKTDSDPR